MKHRRLSRVRAAAPARNRPAVRTRFALLDLVRGHQAQSARTIDRRPFPLHRESSRLGVLESRPEQPMILIQTQRLGEHGLSARGTDGDIDFRGRQKDRGKNFAVQGGKLTRATSEWRLFSMLAIRPEAEPCPAEAERFLPVAPVNTYSTIPTLGMIAGCA